MGSIIRIAVGFLVALLSISTATLSVSAAQQPGCDDYSTTAAAQFALEINAGLAPSLDPDGNGIACDHEAGADSSTSSTGGLQLPADGTSTAPDASANSTAEVVNQQPVTPAAGSTAQQADVPTSASELDGRLGSNEAGFAAVYGEPVDALDPEELSPGMVANFYAPPADGNAADIFVIFANNLAEVIFIGAEATWDTNQAVAIMEPFLPDDVTELPDPQPIEDGLSYLLVFHSTLYETPEIANHLAGRGFSGEAGDFYIVLHTEDGSNIYDIEIGLGNGAEYLVGEADVGTTDTPPPTAATGQTTSTGSTVDATTFLSEVRSEIDRYEAELTEMQTIIAAGTFTDPEIERLSEILAAWVGVETSLPDAPAEHAAIAQALQEIRVDVSSVGLGLVMIISDPDNADTEDTTQTIESLQANLDALDQQLITLGF